MLTSTVMLIFLLFLYKLLGGGGKSLGEGANCVITYYAFKMFLKSSDENTN